MVLYEVVEKAHKLDEVISLSPSLSRQRLPQWTGLVRAKDLGAGVPDPGQQATGPPLGVAIDLQRVCLIRGVFILS